MKSAHSQRHPWFAGAVLGINIVGFAAAAEPPAAEPVSAETPSIIPSWLEQVPIPLEPKALPVELPGLCENKPDGPAWLDRMQASLYRNICLSASRFDGFFGTARFDDEYEAAHGSLAVGTLWDERDHWDPSLRFKARVHLPKLSGRFHAFIGRVDPQEYVTDAPVDFDTLPRLFGERDDDAVLVGLGYSQPSRRAGHFDVSVGTELATPIDPFAKGTYRLVLPFFERNVLRLRETVFWQDSEGLGATTRIDLERLLKEHFLVRWTGSATLTQETLGVLWFSSITLYQNLGRGRAVAYQIGISGESDREVDVDDFGLRIIYRRRIHFDWLFLELQSSVAWPRETLLEHRVPNWGLGAGLEMTFGERTAK